MTTDVTEKVAAVAASARSDACWAWLRYFNFFAALFFVSRELLIIGEGWYGSPFSVRLRGHNAEAATTVSAPPQGSKFLRYVPSALEAEWTANIHSWQDNICAKMASQKVPFQRLLNALDQQHYEGSEPGTPLGAGGRALDALEADGLLSIMEYAMDDGEVVRVRMIPLVGMLRDPRVGCTPHDYGTGAFTELFGVDMYKMWQIQSRMWIYLDPRASALYRDSRARGLLADLGASTWDHEAGSRWLTKRLEQQGARFEHVWAWEAVIKEAHEYFNGADAYNLARLHFYNWPVSAIPNSQDNPWTLIKAAAHPMDRVVIKLDIDTEAIDNALAYQILNDPELLALVDELYYEYHFSNNDIEWLWPGHYFAASVSDTYTLFSQLRHKGVRASPWP